MRAHYYFIAVIVFFSLYSNSFAMDKFSKSYGETHKVVFNNSENCTLCHLYDKDLYEEIEGKAPPQDSTLDVNELAKGNVSTAKVNDPYESDDEDEKSDGIGGWFFGRKKIKKNKGLSDYINNSYKISGFVNKEYVKPHEFSKIITRMCIPEPNAKNPQCHVTKELGNSHAVDVSPLKRYPKMRVPAEIPLNFDNDEFEGVITCGSCHNPHVDWVSPVKSYKHQKSYKEQYGRPQYLTNYARIKDPEMGYYRLCKSCHAEGY